MFFRSTWTMFGLAAIAFTSLSACSDDGAKETKDAADSSVAQPATLRVHYPVGSRSLSAVGDHAPLEVATPFVAGQDDTWQLDIAPIDAPLAVTLSLDGTTARGPAYTIAPGQTLDVYPHFTQQKGRVGLFLENFESTHLTGTKRNIRMYVPPSYDENTTARFPVLYMFDGQILFDTSVTKFDNAAKLFQDCWKVDTAFDEAAESGAFPEAIVIGVDLQIDNPDQPDLEALDTQRIQELTPTRDDDNPLKVPGSGRGEDTLKMVFEEIKPRVDAELRTRPDRDSTYMAGASAGGLMSTWAGIEYGKLLVGVGSFSGAQWWDDEIAVTKAREAKVGPDHAARVYVDVGGNEAGTGKAEDNAPMVAVYEHLVQAYGDAGYVEGETMKSVLDPEGVHKARYWAKRFPAAMAFLLGPGR